MNPRISSPLSVFRNISRLVRQPSRLTLGAAAAAAVAVAGIATGVATSASAGPAPASAAAVSQVGHARLAGAEAAAKPAPARHQAAHTAPAHHAPARAQSRPASAAGHQAAHHQARSHQAPARHQAPHRHSAPARRPYRIYDSVTPSALPSHNAAAVYATGNYAASRAQVAGRKTVLWIDTTGSDHAASVLDVEPGDATPSMAATWARQRLAASPHALARIYTMRSEWPATKAAVAALPAQVRARVRWWIADPTGTPHIVPGSDATQWYWGSSYDISTATPRF